MDGRTIYSKISLNLNKCNKKKQKKIIKETVEGHQYNIFNVNSYLTAATWPLDQGRL